MLTTGVDSGSAFTGTTGNDTFNADLSAAGGNTLNILDRLDGGAGIDTLNAVLAADVTPASISGIEAIVAIGSGGARTLGLANATGVTSVTASGSTGGVITVSGIAAGASLAVQSQAVGADFQYADTSGAADSAALSVSSVTGAAPITIDGVETIAVTASGSASTYQLDADSVTNLSFAGAAAQTVTLAAMTTVSNFDASGATGAVNLTLINQSGLQASTDLTVTGGSGNDTLTVSAHTQSDISVNGGNGDDTIVHTAIATTDTVDGGAGTDILSTTNARVNALDDATPTTYTITNIETLTVSDQYGTGDANLDTLDIATSITKVVLANSAADTDLLAAAATVEGGAGSFAIDLGSRNATNTARVLGQNLTVSEVGGTGTTDSLTLSNTSTVTATGIALDVFDGRDITSTGYESVTINSGATTGGPEQDIGTLTITPDSTAAAVSLTLSGANAVHIDTSLTTTSTGLMTVNASGLAAQAAGTNTFTLDATSQGTGGTASITGSAGDDSIVIGNFASTIVGGAGNDTITGGTAADNLQGGDGIDTISDGGGNDTISGGAGNDVITISGTSVNVDAGDGDDVVNADATLSSGDIVNGGAGNDTLAIDAAATADTSQGVTNFEFLRADTALTQDMVQFTTNGGFTRLISNVAGAVTFNNVGANTNELRAISTGANTLTFDRLLDNSSNALTFGAQTDANTTINNLTANDEETINVVAGGATTAGRTLAITTLTAADLVTLNVSGATNFSTTIAAQGTAALTTINAGSNTGTVNISATNATLGLTVTGSTSAANTIVGGSGADVITGGSAGDDLTGGANADTIDGGAGADTIVGGTGADSLIGGEGADTITGGAGNDTIVLTENVATADRVILAATAAGNGVDAISGFTAGTGGDVLEIDAFLNATAMNAVLTANAAQTADDDVNLLVDIVDGEDITTAAGLTAALAAGGEYASVDMGNNKTAVFVTAASNSSTTQYVFYATSDGAGAITATLVGTIAGVDIDNFVAANFNI